MNQQEVHPDDVGDDVDIISRVAVCLRPFASLLLLPSQANCQLPLDSAF